MIGSTGAAVSREPLRELGAYLFALRLATGPADLVQVVDSAIRGCLAAIGFGAIEERALVPAPLNRVGAYPKSADDFYGAMGAAVFEATVGAAADLDPLDVGPAHLALPATVATCIAAELFDRSDSDVGDAVLAGMEAGARMRKCLTSVRPGAGLHSVGTFGLIAAAAAVARLLGGDGDEIAHSVGIALTRAAGLSLNNAATQIGLTHFGWAAGHGLEAGWLAVNEVEASLDVRTAFSVLFAGSNVDFAPLSQYGDRAVTHGSVAFKHYPCNIYLNPIVQALQGLDDRGGDLVLRIPPIAHLDQPAPANLRQARNSAQAVAAVALLYPPSYAAFVSPRMDPAKNDDLRAAMARVHVIQEAARPTDLTRARIQVSVGPAEAGGLSAEHGIEGLGPWGREHARSLANGTGPPGWVDAIYDGGYLSAHRAVRNLLADGD